MKKTSILLLLLLGLGPLQAQSPAGTERPVGKAPERPGGGIVTRPDSTIAPLIWRVRDRVLKTGDTLRADFLAFGLTDVAAYQFALKFNTARLRFVRIEILSPDLPLDPSGNFGLFNIAGGEIRTLWSAAAGYTLPAGAPVFRLVFATLTGGATLSETLQLDPDVLSAVAYNTVLAPKAVQLYYADYTKPADPRAENEAAPAFQVFSNRPNPFHDCTTLGFALPNAGAVQFRVFDAAGREWMRWKKNCPEGYQEEAVCLESAPAGIMFCELISLDQKYVFRINKN